MGSVNKSLVNFVALSGSHIFPGCFSGELDTLLEDKGISFNKEAADKIREANG